MLIEYKGEGGAAPVIYGEEGDEPLLGTTTLEALGLVLKPFYQNIASYANGAWNNAEKNKTKSSKLIACGL